jgi:hypothetical protein
VHEADEPNAFVDLLDAESLTRQHSRDVDLFAMQAEASAGGDARAELQIARDVYAGKPTSSFEQQVCPMGIAFVHVELIVELAPHR